MESFTIDVNGTKHTVQRSGGTPLLAVLREDLQLTGTKYGCGEGQCGACTVLLGGKTARSCTTAVQDVGSQRVQTIEGLSQASAGRDPAPPRERGTSADLGAGRESVALPSSSDGPELHPVQQAFLNHSAFQCGFCTPGMIMASVGLLNKSPHPNADDIRRELAGNICRCGTFNRIVKAVLEAAEA